jgi:uncharacterized protein YjiS (DUF1127 family)
MFATSTAPVSRSAPSTVFARVQALWQPVAAWRRRRKAIARLHGLSDRCLADIGIERSEIEAVVFAASRDASRRAR